MDEQLHYISEPKPVTLLDVPEPSYRFSPIRVISFCLALLIIFWFFVYFFMFAPPKDFPRDTVFIVEKGETASSVARLLEEDGAIKSQFAFKICIKLFGGKGWLQAGDYYLPEKQNAIFLAYRLTQGAYNLQSVRVTIPEGFNSTEIAALFDSRHFPRFDKTEFLKSAKIYEGYLFPDTYLFMPNVTAEDVVKVMTDTYKKRIESLSSEIRAFGRPIEDIIVMASIIEDEARTEVSRKMIAGILWKRLDTGMALQVDAAFAMVNGKKASEDITLDDLKIDSPYNTYVYKGLPPGPISNPGLAAIKATITPTPSKYYFYLSDKQGEMHYGVNHDEHLANKDRYLR